MNVIYVSSAIARFNKAEVDKTAKSSKLGYSIISFHNSLIEGLLKDEEINNIYSLIGVPVSVRTNSKMIWRFKKDKWNHIEYFQIGFINFPIIKQLLIKRGIVRYLKQLIKNGECVVIYDASFASVVPSVQKVCDRNNIKTIAIFADIYDYMLDVKRKTNHSFMMKSIIRKCLCRAYENASGYVFITDYMNKIINKLNKPYIVVEGILSNSFKKMDINKSSKYKTKTVLYAGGLRTEYGTKNLVNAFSGSDYCLRVYGQGQLEDYVKHIAEGNRNVYYGGMVSNDLIVKEEFKAHLLINTRPNDSEYALYSFPSKTIEYLATGTPTLTTRLPGIPSEYDKYLNYINDNTEEAIASAVEKIFDNYDYYIKKAKKGRQFVEKYKSKEMQAKKLIVLINKL